MSPRYPAGGTESPAGDIYQLKCDLSRKLSAFGVVSVAQHAAVRVSIQWAGSPPQNAYLFER